MGSKCDQALQEFHDLPRAMFGLESYVQRVEALVISEQSDADPQYVGVCGMGGVGKTLLLKRVDGSSKVRGHFQGAKFIWRTVGQTPDIMAVYRSLSEELGLTPESNVTAEDYKLILSRHFRRKRVFLVLDDVWKDETFDSLDLARGKGSVTLFSTRIHSLLVRPTPTISQEYMAPLSEEDSWRLFWEHAFSAPSNVPCELQTLARCMAEECRGLPLALKIIGRAMFGKILPELQWEPQLKKLRESRMQDRTVEEQLYSRLKLGYDILYEDDQRLKNCFLYFAAFPEDSQIRFENILWHWIGMGWVPGNVGDDPTADAFSLLDKLRERSFIESRGKINLDECNLRFNVHDVMRDLALHILEEEKRIPPAKELYIYRAGQNLEKFPKEMEEKPEALILSLAGNKLKFIPGNICAPKLVCLILSGNAIHNIHPCAFSSLLQLRVLDLSGGRFSNLPRELGDLKNLVSLNLFDCACLMCIPESVRKLSKLKHLDVRACGFFNLPSGMGELTSLEVLNIGFRDVIRAENTPPVTEGKGFWKVGPSFDDICKLLLLKEFRNFGMRFPGPKLPHSISALSKLKILNLGLGNIESLPEKMGYWFIQLEVLSLSTSASLQTLPSSFTRCKAFPALLKLALYKCRKFIEVPEVEEGALPKLQTLKFRSCISLQSLPLSLHLLTSLRKLSLLDCGEKLIPYCRENFDAILDIHDWEENPWDESSYNQMMRNIFL